MVSAGQKSGGLLSAARGIIATDGVRGLYRGFGISVVMQAPAVATYLSSYDRAKVCMADASGISAKHPVVHLGAGLVAETVSAVFWVPMEVIKQRAQVREGSVAASSSMNVARDLMRHEGPRALFKGYALTVGVFGPYSMIYFVSYERFKLLWSQRLGMDETNLPLWAVASSASSAGAIAAGLTCPLDIVKTRLQTQGDVTRVKLSNSVKPAHYSSTWHAVKTIAAEEGMRGFSRGIMARVLWITPGTAITMSCFEFLKSHL
jgi:Mitochondrial carrier protein